MRPWIRATLAILGTLWALSPQAWANEATGSPYADEMPRALGPGLQPQGQQKSLALSLYYEGLARARKKDPQGAITRFLQVLKIDPKNLELVRRLAETYVLAGQREDALILLRECQLKNPTHPMSYLYLSEFCERHHQKAPEMLETALKVGKQGWEKFPQNSQLLGHYITLLLRQKQQATAAQVLTKAMAQPIKDPAWWVSAGHLCRQIWRSGQPGSEKVGEAFGKALELGPENTVTLAAVGDYMALHGQTAAALPLFQKIQDLQPEDLKNRQKVAHALGVTQKTEEAIAAWKALLTINPRHLDAHDALARYAEKAGDQKNAFYHRAERLRLDEAPVKQKLALAEQMIGMGQLAREALTMLERAEFDHPGEVAILLAQSRALRQLKEYSATVSTLLRAGKIIEAEKPRDVEVDSFYLQLAQAYELAGELPAAEDAYRRSVTATPKNKPQRAADAYHGLALLWLSQGKLFDEALILVGRGLSFKPDQPDYLHTQGRLFLRKTKGPEAVAALKKALEKKPEDPAIKQDLAAAEALLK